MKKKKRFRSIGQSRQYWTTVLQRWSQVSKLEKFSNVILNFQKKNRKLKKQEITIKNQFDKMKTDNEEAIKQMQQIENENKKLVNNNLNKKKKLLKN